MHEVVSISGLFLAFSVAEKRVDGMEQMCVQICDYVTRGDNESENCRVEMTKHDTQPQYEWEMLQHFIYQPKQRKQLCTGS